MPGPQEDLEKRISVYFAVLLLVVIVLFFRLWYLQVLISSEFKAQAQQNRIRTVALDSIRGKIYDRNKELLVTNKPAYAAVYDGTKEIKTPAVNRLRLYLKLERKELDKKIKEAVNNPLRPVIIKESLTPEEIAYLKERAADFPGVDVQTIALREYVFGSMAAHLIGTMGEVTEEEVKQKVFPEFSLGDVVGKTGIERVLNSELNGVRGIREVEVNAMGDPVRTIREEDPFPGYDLVLTIDRKLQEKTEKALEEAISYAHKDGYTKANGASALVVDPQSGEVLSMASYPVYDPSLFVDGLTPEEWASMNSEESNYPLFNRCVAAAYPPGSVFKPFVLLAALKEKLVGLAETFTCRGKWEEMGKSWPKYCWKRTGHGEINLSRGLAESCDTVFYELGYRFYRTKKENFQAYTRLFGFGAKTGIGLGSEVSGRVPDKVWKEKWFKTAEQQLWLPGDSVNMAIGQGDMLATPIQIAMSYSAILNGGILYTPKLKTSLINEREGIVYRDTKNEGARLPLSEYYLSVVKRGLRRVITEGTAKDAFAGFPVEIGGKTGTSQVAGKDDFAWFVGFAPYNNPKYVVVVLVEQGGHGGTVAALTARKILSHLFKTPVVVPSKLQDASR